MVDAVQKAIHLRLTCRWDLRVAVRACLPLIDSALFLSGSKPFIHFCISILLCGPAPNSWDVSLHSHAEPRSTRTCWRRSDDTVDDMKEFELRFRCSQAGCSPFWASSHDVADNAACSHRARRSTPLGTVRSGPVRKLEDGSLVQERILISIIF